MIKKIKTICIGSRSFVIIAELSKPITRYFNDQINNYNRISFNRCIFADEFNSL